MAKAVIGLDLSGRSWKSVVLSRAGKDKVRIHEYFSLPPLPVSPWLLSPDQDNDAETESQINHWVSRINGSLPALAKKGQVVVGLPQEIVSLRLLDLPFQQRAKLARVLPFEAEGTLPFDIEDLVFDFFPVHKFDGHTRVFTASARRDHLASVLSLLGRLNLDPAVITATALSYHQLSRYLVPVSEAGLKRLAVVHIGDYQTQLAVMEDKQTIFAKTFSFGAYPTLPEPESKLEPGAEPAEPREPSDDEIAEHQSKLPGIISHALERSVHFLEGYNPSGEGCPPPLSRIVLAGEGGLLKELPEKLNQALGMACEVFHLPSSAVAEDSPLREELHPVLAPALALALPRALADDREVLNFRQQEFVFRPERQAMIRKAIMPGLLAVLFFLILILGRIEFGNPDQEQARLIHQEMRDAFRTHIGEPPPTPETRMKELLEEAKAKQQKYQDLTYPTALSCLAAISASIPDSVNVTFTNFQYQGSRINITAIADRTEEVTEIVRQLESVPFFAKVDPQRIKTGAGEAEESSNFNINIDLKKDSLK